MFSARALAFAFVVLVMGSSCVADGARTTPAGGLRDGTAASAANGRTTAYDDGQTTSARAAAGEREEEEVTTGMDGGAGATGSRLPDCTHACGPCSPCRRVMVSLRCAEAAESCPIAYRCMCRGRFFRVPTL
ncbi:protein EPIDERMAL PATTERNING FACTOR 2-like [Oryza brachyantha]|uniref:protein EPIDERMAL PATTERNING FACTOR 2-like n=1 Tax=Oryza brachyantha TaxID=4533 RepID=UPI001ADB5651|nr:protein EPIDERMAL PATTERNING FACTOR 2-like [Oryza brachyantha]